MIGFLFLVPYVQNLHIRWRKTGSSKKWYHHAFVDGHENKILILAFQILVVNQI